MSNFQLIVVTQDPTSQLWMLPPGAGISGKEAAQLDTAAYTYNASTLEVEAREAEVQSQSKEMVWAIKCLPFKHVNLSLIPRTNI